MSTKSAKVRLIMMEIFSPRAAKILIFINPSTEEVPDFKYLGYILILNGQAKGEITTLDKSS